MYFGYPMEEKSEKNVQQNRGDRRMKKKILLAVVVVLICGVFIIKSFMGSKPFKNLSENDILLATVELYPPDAKIDLNGDEIKELVAILQTVAIYNQDSSYSEYDGQAVIFTLEKIDGTQETIQAYNPFVVINGVGYKTKYKPCEELNALGNAIKNSRP
jgi:hypothetical protein